MPDARGRRPTAEHVTQRVNGDCLHSFSDAKTYHLKPIIIREGVQDRSEICHEFTLFDIQARFADVVRLEKVMEYLRRL